MRRTLLLLTPLLLAGCVKTSDSYYVDGAQHTLTVRAEQEFFWDDHVSLTVIAARLPDCQRQFALTELPIDEVNVEVFNAGDNTWNLRAGAQVWQIDTQTCTQQGAPDARALGQPVGSFRLDDQDKLVFQVAGAAR